MQTWQLVYDPKTGLFSINNTGGGGSGGNTGGGGTGGRSPTPSTVSASPQNNGNPANPANAANAANAANQNQGITWQQALIAAAKTIGQMINTVGHNAGQIGANPVTGITSTSFQAVGQIPIPGLREFADAVDGATSSLMDMAQQLSTYNYQLFGKMMQLNYAVTALKYALAEELAPYLADIVDACIELAKTALPVIIDALKLFSLTVQACVWVLTKFIAILELAIGAFKLIIAGAAEVIKFIGNLITLFKVGFTNPFQQLAVDGLKNITNAVANLTSTINTNNSLLSRGQAFHLGLFQALEAVAKGKMIGPSMLPALSFAGGKNPPPSVGTTPPSPGTPPSPTAPTLFPTPTPAAVIFKTADTINTSATDLNALRQEFTYWRDDIIRQIENMNARRLVHLVNSRPLLRGIK